MYEYQVSQEKHSITEDITVVYYTRRRDRGGRQTAYGARPSESRKLRAAAACIAEVASANAMAAEMAAVWCGKYERGDVRAVPYCST